MVIDLSRICQQMVGQTVHRPPSGTLSGHAAGEPFDKLVYQLIKAQLPKRTYRQYEYLNQLYGAHPDKLSYQERLTLIHSPVLQRLLSRGSQPTAGWTIEQPFEEKQNDTADIIVTAPGYYQIIDVKTVNEAKKAQPPNIISAPKLAEMCKLMLEHNDFDSHDIYYLEVRWTLEGDQLRCTASCAKNLFKTDPVKLYINWAAAMQVQFHVRELDQAYAGSKQDWCRAFLRMFTAAADRRIITMRRKYVDAYTPLLEQAQN